MTRPQQYVGHNLDAEIAFVESLAANLNARALRGYCEGLRKRALGFDGRPMNEGARSQLLARAEMHLTTLGADAKARGFMYR